MRYLGYLSLYVDTYLKIVNSDLEDTHVNSHCHKSCFIRVLAAHLMQVVEFHNKNISQKQCNHAT